jgi:general secretion pathway protein G
MKSILLLLALMVSSVVNAASDRSRLMAAHADIAVLENTLKRFDADCGRYPTTTEGFSALIRCPTNVPTRRWHGPCLTDIPSDPWGNEYVYRFPSEYNPNGFDLYSVGFDGISKSGGNDADDINNWNPNSPRGNLSDHIGTFAHIAIIFLFVVNLLLCVALSVMAKFSGRVRDLIATYPTVYDVWVWLSLIGILLFLLSLVVPRIA